MYKSLTEAISAVQMLFDNYARIGINVVLLSIFTQLLGKWIMFHLK